MVWGAVVMAIALLIGGILDMYAQEAGPNQRKYGAGVAAMTFLYTATFGATWLTTPWLYPTEVWDFPFSPLFLFFRKSCINTTIDFPPHRSCKRRRMVRIRMVNRKWCGDNDHTLSLPSHWIRHTSAAMRAEYLRHPVPDHNVSRNRWPKSRTHGCILRQC